jgi:hypothetical protein
MGLNRSWSSSSVFATHRSHAVELKFKPGESTFDRAGEPCRILSVDEMDAEKQYQLIYPNGEEFRAAESGIAL